MEFEQLKKIWDTQNDEPLYGIDKIALHTRIQAKKKQAQHITNWSELLSIIVYAVTGILTLLVVLPKQGGSMFMYILSGWMLTSACYLLASRIRRRGMKYGFDQSMSGDLKYAISMAGYQVRISRLMRWNILPIGILTALGIWDGGKPLWMTLVIIFFFALTYYASGWEHGIYKARKRELEILKEKLSNGEAGNQPS